MFKTPSVIVGLKFYSDLIYQCSVNSSPIYTKYIYTLFASIYIKYLIALGFNSFKFTCHDPETHQVPIRTVTQIKVTNSATCLL